MTTDDVATPAERFAAVLDKYECRSIDPLEIWSTDDLIDLQEAIRAELSERDREAQDEYFYQDSDGRLWPQSYGGTD